MTKIRILFLLNFMLCRIIVFAQHPTVDPNWRAVIQDDFTTFNTILWEKVNNLVHGKDSSEEPQVYTSNNVYINNGNLVLRTIRQDHTCPLGNICYHGGSHQYTSGEICSRASYRYGYYEIYAKIPTGQGYWPAFWLWNQTPDSQTTDCWYNEIDIFEGNGCVADSVTCNVHWNFECPRPAEPKLNDRAINIPAANYSQTYHWYGIEWNENEIIWYIDRQKIRSIANDMDGIGIQNPMYIIINSALIPDGWKTCLVDDANIILPNYMYVDKANVFQLICDDNTVVNEIYDYDTFSYGIKKSITLSGTASLSSGQNIFLKATDFIELQSGFEAPSGSQLSLQIMDCPNY